MAFGWSAVDFEIWEELGLEIGSRTRQHFRKPALVGETVFQGGRRRSGLDIGIYKLM